MSKLSDYGLVPLPEYADIDVTQVPYRGGHRYKVTGYDKPLAGVTTHLGIIAKPFLVPWARKQTSQRWLGEMQATAADIFPGTAKATADRIMLRLSAVEERNKPGEDGYDEYLKEVLEWAAQEASDEQAVGHEKYLNQVFDWAKADDTEGRDLGTATHNLIENLLAGTQNEVDDETRIKVQPAVDGAMKAIRLKNLETIGVEVPVWHPFYHYAGMIDYVGREPDGCIAVLDWKRAERFSDEYAMQVAAYSDTLRITLGLPYFPRGYVAKLPKEEGGDTEVKEANVGNAIEVFLKAQRLKESTGAGAKVWV